MFIPPEMMVARHLGTVMCKKGEEKNYHHLSATAAQVSTGKYLWVWNQVLEKGDTFKYL